MKKFAKRSGIFIAILLILGIGLIVTGVCIGIKKVDFTEFHWGPDNIGEEKKAVLEPFNEISIYSEVSDIEILEGTEYAIEYCVSDGEFTYEVKEGQLVINQDCDEFVHNILGGHNGADIKIYIPADSNSNIKNIYIENDVGDVKILGSFNDATISIENNVGDIDIEGEILANINVENNVGDIKVDIDTKESVYKFELNTDVGDVRSSGEVTDIKYAQYTIDIDANVGDVDVTIEKK